MEHQAFGRVYRMGQKKETHYGRIMARNTIDERLAELQRQKLEVIGQTIKDHDSSRATLTAEEIASLLGRVVRDEDGNFVDIEPDYRDDDADTAGEEIHWSDEDEDEGSDRESGCSASHGQSIKSSQSDSEDFTF